MLRLMGGQAMSDLNDVLFRDRLHGMWAAAQIVGVGNLTDKPGTTLIFNKDTCFPCLQSKRG